MYKNRLKHLREEANLKIADISRLFNFENSTYGKYEREYDVIPIKHLNTICNYFNVSIDYVFNFNNKRNYSVFNAEIDKKISGIRLKEFRKSNKITQEVFANFLNIERSAISKYEKGVNIIATQYLFSICSKYKISADYLLGRIDEPKYLK